METQKYQKYNKYTKQPMKFKALYIKNGTKDLQTKTILLVDIEGIDKNITINHIWSLDKKGNFAKKLARHQHKTVEFIAELTPITKPYSLYECKKDLGLKILSIEKIY